ncbi:hypothetical protein PCE31106_00119 [Pandoraea cepalis]|uniref:Uncharacterized protein n=1 Tax=Pandoraea cepalis TaxID=2508294 RepID=A0A5E4RDW8_9BURK|nr:hypothetical protein [Pandoraea cepalis]VVD61480.1 hypothetical protein PCE31106_00119 [Pandoraea cepalis]
MARIEGRLKMLGEGRVDQYGWTIRTVAEIGDREIHNLRVSPRLSNYLNVGEPVALGVQRVLGATTVYAVASPDGRVRHGAIGGLLFLLMLYVLAGLFCWHEITNHGSALYGAALAVIGWMALGPLNAIRLCVAFDPMKT